MRFLRPFLTVYGTGIVGTFGWLFFALSGTTACAASRYSCETVIALTGRLALAWPAYWGGRLTGEPIVTPLPSIEVAGIAVLVFVIVLVLARVHALFEEPAAETEQVKPLIRTTEPNRRNQSQTPSLADAGRH